jgi:hypothetical protein
MKSKFWKKKRFWVIVVTVAGAFTQLPPLAGPLLPSLACEIVGCEDSV